MADQRSTLTLALVDGISGPGAKAGAALRNLGVSVQSVKGILGGLGLAFGAAEIGRFAKEAVSAYAEHETGLLRLRQLYNASARQIADAHERMFAVAHQFGRPIEQVEAAMRVYGELGYSLDRALAALPRAAKAADVLNTEIARMAGLEPLLARAGIRNLDQAYNDLYETSKHVQGGFPGMEGGLRRLIPLLGTLRWNNDEGFRKLLAYIRAVAPAVGGAEAAVEGFYNVMSAPGKRRLDTAFQRAFGKDFSLADEMKKAVAQGRDPFRRFIELADEAIDKLGSVGALFPNAAMRNWFIGLHNNMRQVNSGMDDMKRASGSMDKAAQENAETTKRKIDQLGVAWQHFKDKLGETLVNQGALAFLSRLEAVLADIEKRLEEIDKKGLKEVLKETSTTATDKARGQVHDLFNWLDQLGIAERARIEGRTPEQEAEEARIRAQGLVPERYRIPQPFAPQTSPPPAPSVPTTPEPPPYLGRPMRRRMSNEQIERAIPPPVEPAPVDFSDVVGAVPQQFGDAGKVAGQAFNAALGTELNHSVGMIQQFTDWASKALGFRASPQIAPSFSTAVGVQQGPGSRAATLGRGAFSDSGPVPVR